MTGGVGYPSHKGTGGKLPGGVGEGKCYAPRKGLGGRRKEHIHTRMGGVRNEGEVGVITQFKKKNEED